MTITAPQQVIVEIAPGFCPNVVNTNEGGVIQVAIVGTQSLNVSNIIPASVTLNGVLADTNSFIADVAVPFVYTKGCPEEEEGWNPGSGCRVRCESTHRQPEDRQERRG